CASAPSRPFQPPPRSTLFPYTTLFRSAMRGEQTSRRRTDATELFVKKTEFKWIERATIVRSRNKRSQVTSGGQGRSHLRRELLRSEEHTSELQSRFDLVCRLVLEKKTE